MGWILRAPKTLPSVRFDFLDPCWVTVGRSSVICRHGWVQASRKLWCSRPPSLWLLRLLPANLHFPGNTVILPAFASESMMCASKSASWTPVFRNSPE